MKLPIVWVCLLTILPGPGADFVIHTVDGLNRPLTGVEVDAMIFEALAYVRSNPQPFVGRDLEALARRTALALRIGVWKGDLESRFNRAGDKALIDLTFEAGLDRYTYTATFHYSDGVWSLRGAHETLQALMAR